MKQAAKMKSIPLRRSMNYLDSKVVEVLVSRNLARADQKEED